MTSRRPLVWLAAAANLLPAQGPENVLLVFNRNSSASGEIARYYTTKRLIPRQNLCAIRAPADETVTRQVYTQQVEAPVRACLESLPAKTEILYLVTVKGVPLRIAGSHGENGTASAVDSELTLLYQRMRGRQVPLEGPAHNPFYRQKNTKFDQRRFPIYLVTRLDAYDPATVRRMIDGCLKAANRGRFVLDLRSEDDDSGNGWLLDTAILLPKERAVVDRSRQVLTGLKDVIGYAGWGSNDRNRKQRRLGFSWLPGGIATEFVSSNGRTFTRPPEGWTLGTWNDRSSHYADSPQSLAADYLEEGASGVSGHVYEPFLEFTPRPDYLLPAYYAGRNLAESFWLSIPALSWMNVVVGDPLCRLGPP